jgi:hypothetical protein
VVVKDLKVDFSACQKTNYIVQGGGSTAGNRLLLKLLKNYLGGTGNEKA